MKKVVVSLTTLIVGMVLGLLIGSRNSGVGRVQDPGTTGTGPTLEAVKSLASLVTTRVTVSDVQLTRLQGYTGAAKAALLVRGDFTIGTDLAEAKFTRVDPLTKSVVLSLRPPTAGSPRVDLGRTRLVALGTEGLWGVVPGQTVEEVVTNDGYRDAQASVGRISREPQWQDQARRQAESVLRTFFGSIGWTVAVEWAGS